MSLALATKGIIAQFARGGGLVYVPIDEPDVETDEIGFPDMYGTTLEHGPAIDYDARSEPIVISKEIEPDLSSIELKPKMKAE